MTAADTISALTTAHGLQVTVWISALVRCDSRKVLCVIPGRKSGGGFFKFVAHDKGDLTGGTLYAAKFSGKFGSLDSFTISWIKLGRATNDELLKASKSIKFSDMIDFVPTSKTCQGTLKFVNVKSTVECIGIRSGMEKWAAFFETRRYAALQGASIELSNAKGLAFDPDNSRLLMSFNRITARDKIMVQVRTTFWPSPVCPIVLAAKNCTLFIYNESK